MPALATRLITLNLVANEGLQVKTTLVATLVTAAAVIVPSTMIHAQDQTAVRGSKSPMFRAEKREAAAEAIIRQRVRTG